MTNECDLGSFSHHVPMIYAEIKLIDDSAAKLLVCSRMDREIDIEIEYIDFTDAEFLSTDIIDVMSRVSNSDILVYQQTHQLGLTKTHQIGINRSASFSFGYDRGSELFGRLFRIKIMTNDVVYDRVVYMIGSRYADRIYNNYSILINELRVKAARGMYSDEIRRLLNSLSENN